MTKVAIIIPTFNRPTYLRRLLGYYSGYKINYKIIIADSSSSENKRQNKKIIKHFPDLNILHLSAYPININPNRKIFYALSHIKSRYCVICADDDFITLNGINQSVDFLEKNPDFTVVQGNYISFYLKKDKARKESQFCWALGQQFDSITFPDAKSRLDFHLSNYQVATFYAVHRTDFLKMISEETLRFTDDTRFLELLLSMLTLIYGKMKCLDVLFAARDAGSVPTATDLKYFYHLEDFIKIGTYDEKYTKFKNCLVTHLTKNSQLDIEEAKKVVDKAMSAYIKKSYHPLVSEMVDILHKLNMPDWVNKKISLLYRWLFSLPKKEYYSNLTNPLPTEYCNDFNKIRTCVISHAIKNNKIIK